MTSSRLRLGGMALALLAASAAHAGLGGAESDIDGEAGHLHARHATRNHTGYVIHDMVMADGSHIRQYTNASHQVFAVTWNTQFKPDLARLLGDAYKDYSQPRELTGLRKGIQRDYRYKGQDLIMRSTGHLHLFTGFAYRPSLLPLGFSPAKLSVE